MHRTVHPWNRRRAVGFFQIHPSFDRLGWVSTDVGRAGVVPGHTAGSGRGLGNEIPHPRDVLHTDWVGPPDTGTYVFSTTTVVKTRRQNSVLALCLGCFLRGTTLFVGNIAAYKYYLKLAGVLKIYRTFTLTRSNKYPVTMACAT